MYWAIAGLWPGLHAGGVALCAAVVAVLVELLKKVYWGPLDHFRETLAGKLLLGRYFSYGAVVAYLLAIGVVAVLDHFVSRTRGAA